MKKKIGSSIIIGSQLLVASVFLVMLFTENKGQEKLAVIKNENLNKMNDRVIELFKESDQEEVKTIETEVVIELKTTEEVKEEIKKQEEAIKVNNFSQTIGSVFAITTDNKIYDLTVEEKDKFIAVVSAEAKKKSYDDALAVVSIILNRADTNGKWGNGIIGVIEKPGQFSVFATGAYKKYINGNGTSEAKQAVEAGLKGVRNNKFISFNCWTCSTSNNYVIEGGNRYR